ncbi:MAG: transcription antitermination factor NusB [Candidatus Sumerlaeota bacterium]|nr:transcription antitermination factor NusB [Candidatus Sumerlaeota bacterium]
MQRIESRMTAGEDARAPSNRPIAMGTTGSQVDTLMPRRRIQRELAAQLAYAMDVAHDDDFEDARYRFTQAEPKRRKGWGEYAERLAREALARRDEIDARLRGALQHWRLERLAAIDRAILRLAVCELLYFPEMPSRVTIDEFIDIARDYGNDESPAFVNGVLDAIARHVPGKELPPVGGGEEE